MTAVTLMCLVIRAGVLMQGFNVTYDPPTQSVNVDRAIIRGAYTVTLQT